MSTVPTVDRFIRSYDGDLDVTTCQSLINRFEAACEFHVSNGRNAKAALAHSSWTELSLQRLGDPALINMLRRKMTFALGRYNRDVQLSMPVPNSPQIAELILKRYRPGGDDRFQLHFDSVHEVASRYLVFLWYLNDVDEGGATEFPDLGISVRPSAGRLLVFPPYWMFQHVGQPPISGDKYILSTYLLFQA